MARTPGEMVWWPGALPATLPAQWLACDGSLVATATYPRLFAAIGYLYGGAVVNFALPDVNNRLPIMPGTALILASSDGLAEALRFPNTHVMTGGTTASSTGFAGGHIFSNPSGVDSLAPVQAQGPGPVVASGSPHSHANAPLDNHAIGDSLHSHAQGNTAARANFPPFLGLNMIIYAG